MASKTDKKHLIGLSFVIFHLSFSATLTSCGSDDEPFVTIPEAFPGGTMQDLDGNTYRWVRIDTLDWMAENLRAGTPWYLQTRFAVKDGDEDCYPLFGNYYNWEEAQAQCPAGWRLPTDEDWKCLERACGMTSANTDRTGWRNGAALLLASAEAVSLCYGGELSAFNTAEVKLYHPYDYGLYWSATIDTTYADRCAFIRKITPALNEVQRISTPVATHWLSVRYVKTAK